MIKKFLILLSVATTFFLYSCGGGDTTYAESKYSTVEGKISTSEENQIQTQSLDDVAYILAATYVNEEPVFVSGAVDFFGNFEIKLLKDKTYSFVIFNNKLKPIAYVKRGDKNAIFIEGDVVRVNFILVDENYDGIVDYAYPQLDRRSRAKLVRDERFSKDDNFNQKPDTFETDKDKNKKFDGIEDRNKNGYPDSIDDENQNNIPDVLEELDKKEDNDRYNKYDRYYYKDKDEDDSKEKYKRKKKDDDDDDDDKKKDKKKKKDDDDDDDEDDDDEDDD